MSPAVTPPPPEAPREFPYLDDAGALTDLGRGVLDLERKRYDFTGSKEQAIRDRFDLTATRYYQLLNTMVEDVRVEALEPMLVRRLRRLRDSRQRGRSARRLGIN